MLLEFGAGRVDFLQLPSSVANYLAAEDKALIVETQDHLRPTQHYHMAARADDSALIKELNASIVGLKDDGTLVRLAAEYITNADGTPAGFNVALLNAITQ